MDLIHFIYRFPFQLEINYFADDQHAFTQYALVNPHKVSIGNAQYAISFWVPYLLMLLSSTFGCRHREKNVL